MITTKGRDFALPLVRRAHLGVSDELVFGLEAGKKVRSLTFFPLLTRTHTQTYKHRQTHMYTHLRVEGFPVHAGQG